MRRWRVSVRPSLNLQNRLLWLRKKVFGQMSEKVLPSDPAQLSLFDEKHLTGEERARLDREVEEAEKTITKTITVKARPSRRPLDTTGLPEKVFHIYPDGVLDGDGNLKGCLPQGHPQVGHRDKAS